MYIKQTNFVSMLPFGEKISLPTNTQIDKNERKKLENGWEAQKAGAEQRNSMTQIGG